MFKSRRSESGQAAILLALAMVGLVAFAALAIDGGNAYLVRRNGQNAADAAAINGTRLLHRIINPAEGDEALAFPDGYLRTVINDAAQRNGVPDTNDDLADTINNHIEAYYLDENGGRASELQIGSLGLIPSDARGVEVIVDIPFDTFLAGIIGRDNMVATTAAGAIFTERSGTVQSAIYANATTCDPNTLSLSGSQQVIGGGMHSNGDVSVNGNASNPSVYTGTLEYATNADIKNAVVINPPDNQATQGSANVLDELFNIEDYAPGGSRAVEAGGKYYYFDSSYNKVQKKDLEDRLLLDGDGNLQPGIYFAENNFEINGSLTGVGVTFVTRNDITINSSTAYLTPYPGEMLLMYARGGESKCTHEAISFSVSSAVWRGLLYAPYGRASFSASSNCSAYGSIVAYTVSLSGSSIEIHYDEKYDPLVPPKVVLVW